MWSRHHISLAGAVDEEARGFPHRPWGAFFRRKGKNRSARAVFGALLRRQGHEHGLFSQGANAFEGPQHPQDASPEKIRHKVLEGKGCFSHEDLGAAGAAPHKGFDELPQIFRPIEAFRRFRRSGRGPLGGGTLAGPGAGVPRHHPGCSLGHVVWISHPDPRQRNVFPSLKQNRVPSGKALPDEISGGKAPSALKAEAVGAPVARSVLLGEDFPCVGLGVVKDRVIAVLDKPHPKPPVSQVLHQKTAQRALSCIF